MNTITLTSIMNKWATILANDPAIKAFCQEKYALLPTVFIGFNEKKPPTVADCPVIIIFPGNKDEGLDQEVFTYRLSIGWSIVNETADTTVLGIVKYVGVEEADALGQLIWSAIAEAPTGNPVSRIYFDLEAVAWFPQIPGRMDLEIDIRPPFGGTISY